MDANYAAGYAELQKNHWWFRARFEILRRLIGKLPWTESPRIMEIGCGPGETLYRIYPPRAKIWGVEPDATNAAIARARGDIPILQTMVDSLPPEIADESFDGIAMLDVIEHIENEQPVLAIVRKKLAPKGFFIVTVPAYQCLWGRQDDVSHHFRRYTATRLRADLKKAGFQIEHMTYFNTFLFPPIATVRLACRLLKISGSGKSDFDYTAGFLDRLLYHVFAAEAGWLARMNFPFGLSIFAIARKTR